MSLTGRQKNTKRPKRPSRRAKERSRGRNKDGTRVVVCIDEHLPNMRIQEFRTRPLEVINYHSGMSDESIGRAILEKAKANPKTYYLMITLDGGFRTQAGECGVWELRNTCCRSIWHYPKFIKQAMRGTTSRRRSSLAHAGRRPKVSAIKAVYEDFITTIYENKKRNA